MIQIPRTAQYSSVSAVYGVSVFVQELSEQLVYIFYCSSSLCFILLLLMEAGLPAALGHVCPGSCRWWWTVAHQIKVLGYNNGACWCLSPAVSAGPALNESWTDQQDRELSPVVCSWSGRIYQSVIRSCSLVYNQFSSQLHNIFMTYHFKIIRSKYETL